MQESLKIRIAQINPKAGDIDGNYSKIVSQIADAAGSDLIIFPELALVGYGAEDFLLRKNFISYAKKKFFELQEFSKTVNCAIIFGTTSFNQLNGKLYNSSVLLENGQIIGNVCKRFLPNYGVFDEKRYFEPASSLPKPISFRGLSLLILTCEDIWNDETLSDQKCDIIISINSSPYQSDKKALRLDRAKKAALHFSAPVFYVNQVGGQDSIIFDGSSFVLDKSSNMSFMLDGFAEDTADIEVYTKTCEISLIKHDYSKISSDESDYCACVLGLRDYVYKNGFKSVMLGMSGGVDSAISAAIAVDALGSENVKLYALPTRFSSELSLSDAYECAKRLSVEIKTISIDHMFETMVSEIGQGENQARNALSFENLQARIRGIVLMTISNQTGHLLITTGNKSEIATGYTTIYGDMCGGYNPIKDLYKTKVYKIVNYRNSSFPRISLYKKTDVIPQSIITKSPSAELRFEQKDSDSLPEYEVLDQILDAIIEKRMSYQQVIDMGFEEELIKKIFYLIYRNEHKRNQSAPGPKISSMSFDRDWRYPISSSVSAFLK